ncbi:MAG TPA: hypothetical protein VIC61_04525 [Gammaproteobacteria bacterium]
MNSSKHRFVIGFLLATAAGLSAAGAAGGEIPATVLVLSGSSVNLDNSTRALAAGRDGAAIRYAGRVIERNPDRVEAAIARHNLCLAWMGQGGVEEAETHCRFAAAADLGDARVRRDGDYFVIARRNADGTDTESLQAVLGRNLAAQLERLNTSRVASSATLQQTK